MRASPVGLSGPQTGILGTRAARCSLLPAMYGMKRPPLWPDPRFLAVREPTVPLGYLGHPRTRTQAVRRSGRPPQSSDKQRVGHARVSRANQVARLWHAFAAIVAIVALTRENSGGNGCRRVRWVRRLD